MRVTVLSGMVVEGGDNRLCLLGIYATWLCARDCLDWTLTEARSSVERKVVESFRQKLV